jgi:hypothetical protein
MRARLPTRGIQADVSAARRDGAGPFVRREEDDHDGDE